MDAQPQRETKAWQQWIIPTVTAVIGAVLGVNYAQYKDTTKSDAKALQSVVEEVQIKANEFQNEIDSQMSSFQRRIDALSESDQLLRQELLSRVSHRQKVFMNSMSTETSISSLDDYVSSFSRDVQLLDVLSRDAYDNRHANNIFRVKEVVVASRVTAEAMKLRKHGMGKEYQGRLPRLASHWRPIGAGAALTSYARPTGKSEPLILNDFDFKRRSEVFGKYMLGKVALDRFKFGPHNQKTDLDEARGWFEDVIRHDPDFAKAYANLAVVLRKQFDLQFNQPNADANQLRELLLRSIDNTRQFQQRCTDPTVEGLAWNNLAAYQSTLAMFEIGKKQLSIAAKHLSEARACIDTCLGIIPIVTPAHTTNAEVIATELHFSVAQGKPTEDEALEAIKDALRKAKHRGDHFDVRMFFEEFPVFNGLESVLGEGYQKEILETIK